MPHGGYGKYIRDTKQSTGFESFWNLKRRSWRSTVGSGLPLVFGVFPALLNQIGAHQWLCGWFSTLHSRVPIQRLALFVKVTVTVGWGGGVEFHSDSPLKVESELQERRAGGFVKMKEHGTGVCRSDDVHNLRAKLILYSSNERELSNKAMLQDQTTVLW